VEKDKDRCWRRLEIRDAKLHVNGHTIRLGDGIAFVMTDRGKKVQEFAEKMLDEEER